MNGSMIQGGDMKLICSTSSVIGGIGQQLNHASQIAGNLRNKAKGNKLGGSGAWEELDGE